MLIYAMFDAAADAAADYAAADADYCRDDASCR